MASERIINEYDSTRIANAVDTLATNLADYSGTTVTPTDAMKAKLPSQTTADRIADAVETLAQNVTSLSDLVRASYEESPAIYAHAIDDILYYNNKFYDVTSAIAIGDTLTVSSGLIEGNISERLGGMSYEVFGIPVGGSGGTVIADDNTYNALIRTKSDGTGEEVANNKTAGGDETYYFETKAEMDAAIQAGEVPTGAICVVNEDTPYVVKAEAVAFDNTDTELTATDVDGAIKELNTNVSSLNLISETINKQNNTTTRALGVGQCALIMLGGYDGDSTYRQSLYLVSIGATMSNSHITKISASGQTEPTIVVDAGRITVQSYCYEWHGRVIYGF